METSAKTASHVDEVSFFFPMILLFLYCYYIFIVTAMIPSSGRYALADSLRLYLYTYGMYD